MEHALIDYYRSFEIGKKLRQGRGCIGQFSEQLYYKIGESTVVGSPNQSSRAPGLGCAPLVRPQLDKVRPRQRQFDAVGKRLFQKASHSIRMWPRRTPHSRRRPGPGGDAFQMSFDINDCRPTRSEGLIQRAGEFTWLVYGKPKRAHRFGYPGEIGVLE